MSCIRRFVHSCLHLIYPPLCLYCRCSLIDPDVLFCRSCADLLELIDIPTRCNYCFGEVSSHDKRLCGGCRKLLSPLTATAAAFDYLGPAACLVKQLKYGNQPHLAGGASAFLVAQWTRLGWPLPDAIVPVPMPLFRRMSRGYNQSHLLATELGKLLQCPVILALTRRSGDHSQAGLKMSQRRLLSGGSFCMRAGIDLADKTVLLLDDVMTSGSTLRRCAEVLWTGYPSAIYGLAVCRATK